MPESNTATHRISKSTKAGRKKVFVLDTNVFLHDPTSVFRFDEHDVFLPMKSLEELDHNKKGLTEVSRNAREVARTLDEIIKSYTGDIVNGIPLVGPSMKLATGRLFLQTMAISNELPPGLPGSSGDNQILAVVIHLKATNPNTSVILVSKDINMRIKAKALGLEAQDYFNDKVLEDTDMLYTGALELPSDFWDMHSQGLESHRQSTGRMLYRATGPLCAKLFVGQFLFHEAGNTPFYAVVRSVNGDTAEFETINDYSHQKNAVWGITARNREQNFALNALMDPDIDFVSLLGQAGTGKTLLTIASALTQVLETALYSEIIMTRVTVPVGDDIGFLPGNEEEKMGPWMGALEDNLEVLAENQSEGLVKENGRNLDTHVAEDWKKAATQDLIRKRIKIKSLNFMRGRTFLNKFLIIDEAQNLTPKQMKTLITRAGPGTKVVIMGNISQIDTPYLTEGSSGLTYVVDRFIGWPHGGHVILQKGERSRLADYASEKL